MHISVLPDEIAQHLAIKADHTIVDATVNGGGHARMIADHLGAMGHIIGIDVDTDALSRAKNKLDGVECNVTLINGNFRNLSRLLSEHGVDGCDRILFDLGWSSNQIEDSERGFSFLHDGPLVMTLAKKESSSENTLTARDIVNTWDEHQLSEIIKHYGEERFAGRIARAIVESRSEIPIERTVQLADIIANAVPHFYRKRKIHPATKTFQALRITVNDEYQALEEGLSEAKQIIRPGGRIAVISFHSIEDRLVKRTFLSWKQEGTFHIITKKPIIPSQDEQDHNRRSRSAKLRIIERIT